MLSQRQALDFLLRLPLVGRLGPAFLRYVLVGGLGFIADALLLEIFVRLSLSVYIARLLSMTLAMGCTYALHRNFTFTDAAKPARTGAQVIAFLVCQLIAAGVNYGVFCLLLAFMPAPVGLIGRMFSLCCGVGAGLAVNFFLLRLFVFPASGRPLYETLAPRSVWRVLPWLLAVVYFMRLVVQRLHDLAQWPQLQSELGPADPDIWMRLAQLRDWLAGGDFFSHAVLRTNAPFGGIETHWTRPMDFLLAALARMQGGDINAQLMAAAAWLPPLLGLVALAFLICAATRRFDNIHAVWCAALLFLFSPLAAYFSPGDADHHGLLAMLWCGVLCCVLRPQRRAAALFAGVLLGLMVWVSIEALMPLAAVYAVLGYFTLKDARAIRPLAVLALSCAITATLGLVIERADILTPLYDTLSIAHVALLWFIAIGAAVLCLPRITAQRPLLRAAYAVNAAAFALLAEIVLFPDILLGPMAGTDNFIGATFLGRISEALGVFSHKAPVILETLWMPVLAVLLVFITRDRSRETKTLLLLMGMGVLMVLAQGRWTYYLQPAAIILTASLLPAVAMRCIVLKRLERMFRPAAAVLVVVGLLGILDGFLPRETANDDVTCQRQMRYIVQTQQLKNLPVAGGVIYAPPGIGGDIIFFTPYSIIAGNYHREGAGLRELDDIAHDDKAEFSRRRFERRHVSAAFVCPATEGWWKELSPQHHPAWLQPQSGLKYLDIPGPKPQLYAVTGEPG